MKLHSLLKRVALAFSQRRLRGMLPNFAVLIVGVFTMYLLTGCAADRRLVKQAWQTPLMHDHPLVGKIVHAESKRFISGTELLNELKTGRYILLGEKHDNADHHLGQAQIIRGLPNLKSVVLEMLNRGQRERLSQVKDVNNFRSESGWDKSGWPKYSIYEPVIDAIYKRGMLPGVGNPSREAMMASMKNGDALRSALDQGARAQLTDDIKVAHCGHLNDRMAEAMVAVQIFKDQTMAHELRSQAGFDQGVLIAGNGHIRKDYGVPKHLERTVSVAFMEVQGTNQSVDDYDVHLYDYVVFTPRVDNLDPCERFKKQLQKLRDG